MARTMGDRSLPDTFSLVGAGRMGTALALALAAGGLRPLWIASRTAGNRRRARRLLGGSCEDFGLR